MSWARRGAVVAIMAALLAGAGSSPAATLEDGGAQIFEGEIPQSLFTAGAHVTVNARVAGHVGVAGQVLEFSGDYDGNLFAAAEQIVVNARVADNAFLAAAVIRVSRNAEIGRRLRIVARDIKVLGNVNGNVFVAGQDVALGGVIGGDVTVLAPNIVLEPGLYVKGRLSYRGTAPAVPAGVVIEGGVNELGETSWLPGFGLGAMFGLLALVVWVFGSLLALILLAGVLHWLMPGLLWGAAAKLSDSPGASFAVGLAVLVGVPILTFVLMATLIGIPTGLLLIVLYGLFWLVAVSVTTAWIGRVMARRLGRDLAALSRGAAFGWLVAGALVLFVLVQVPVLGGLAALLLFIAAMGAIVLRGGPQLRH